MPAATAPFHDAARLEEMPDVRPFFRAAAEKHPHAARHVALDDLRQDLGAGAVEARDAVDVEDDVAVVLRVADARQGRVGGGGAVAFEAPQPALEVARVGEGQGLGDLDDEAAVEEFDGVGAGFGVLVLVARAGDFAEDLDSRFGGVADDREEGEADAQSDAEGEGVEHRGEEDEEHEEEFVPGLDVKEEIDVVRGFFDERVGDHRDHGGQHGFLKSKSETRISR